MAKHSFTPLIRYAVYTIHGEKCYLCWKPLDLKTMEVDHIIPEKLLHDPGKLVRVLRDLGRPPDFNLNSYHNWLPACRSCNNRKSDLIFDPAPIILIYLQSAAAKAEKAEELVRETITQKEITKGLNLLLRADEAQVLDPDTISKLEPLVEFHRKKRLPETSADPIRLTPLYEVLREEGGVRVIQGPYGVGGGPINPSSSFICPYCGFSAWSGARCVVCGEMSDD